MRRLALIALTLVPLAPHASRAQPAPSDAQAQALQAQIRGWLGSMLGSDIKIGEQPVAVTAQGDHYAIAIPLGSGADRPRMTASAEPRSGGRWAVYDIHYPSPATFTIDLPDKQTPGNPSPMAGPMTYDVAFGKQTSQLLLDPSFATPTTLTSSLENVDIAIKSDLMDQKSHTDRSNTSMVAQPSSADRVNVSVDTTLEGYRLASNVPGKQDGFALALGRARVSGTMDDVSRERAMQIMQAAIKFGVLLQGAGTMPDAEKETAAKAFLSTLIDAIADLTTGGGFEEKVDNLGLDIAGMQGGLKAFTLGFGAKNKAGLLESNLTLGAEGLTLPDLGLGSKAALIPTKIALRQTTSGIPTDVLLKLLNAVKEGGSPDPSDVMDLFGRGGIVAGLDNLTIAVAGAEFTAQSKVTIASPQNISGTGQITATNLDSLQQRIAAEPELAQAGPAIIFMKGIGRMVENRMVWDVAYSGGHLLVNNQDMFALMGGGGGADTVTPDVTPTPEPAPAPRQAPPARQPLRRRQ